jgi:hypothetical protein
MGTPDLGLGNVPSTEANRLLLEEISRRPNAFPVFQGWLKEQASLEVALTASSEEMLRKWREDRIAATLAEQAAAVTAVEEAPAPAAASAPTRHILSEPLSHVSMVSTALGLHFGRLGPCVGEIIRVGFFGILYSPRTVTGTVPAGRTRKLIGSMPRRSWQRGAAAGFCLTT